MPTILLIDGYRFFFYSNEGNEPPHVHVEKGDATAKWWLAPARMAWNDGFKPAQLRRIAGIVRERRDELLRRWREHFGE